MKAGFRQTGLWMAAGMACALAAACPALAAGGTAWEREMAQGRRPEMPSERTRAQWRSTRGMVARSAGETRAAFEAVANGALAASGASLPAGADWETAYASGEERVGVAEFRDGAGRVNRMAVYEQLGTRIPYYWTVEGGTADEVSANARKTLEVNGVLDRSEVRMTELGEEVVPPYGRFRFRFLDDAPEGDWIRPCRYVFEDADGGGTTVMWRRLPPRITSRASGAAIPWKGAKNVEVAGGETSGALQAATAGVREWSRGLREAGNGLAAGGRAGDGHVHFVLFSGGADKVNNRIRYWCDTAMLYSTLRLRYGVPKDCITVLMSDGKSAGTDANLADGANLMAVSSPQDLDGDGTDDIDGPASREALRDCFERLSRTLAESDQLWFFATGHGSAIGLASADNHDAAILCWTDTEDMETFSDEEFAQWTAGIRCPMAVALEPCFAGGFVDDMENQANRVIATASSHYESSFGMGGGGGWADGQPEAGQIGTRGKTCSANYWSLEFISALRGVRPRNLEKAAYPWEDGDTGVDADGDGDGRVSFREAAGWARENDVYACPRATHTWGGEDGCLLVCSRYQSNRKEHPQYAESVPGLGDRMTIADLRNAGPENGGAEEAADNGGEGGKARKAGGGNPGPAGQEPYRLPIPKAAFKTNL